MSPITGIVVASVIAAILTAACLAAPPVTCWTSAGGTIEQARHLVERLEQSCSRSPEAIRGALCDAVAAVSASVESLEILANGYPRNPIQASVWLDGVELASLAHRVALIAREKDETELEEKALSSRARATLAVQSHYHHIVGPAMLDHVDCLLRLGRPEQALENLIAVIADFTPILEESEADDEEVCQEYRCALICLKDAAELRMRLGDAERTPILCDLPRRVDAVLARPATTPHTE